MNPAPPRHWIALNAVGGVLLIGLGAVLAFAWSFETANLQWLLLFLAIFSTLAGAYFAASASRGSRELPRRSSTVADEVINALAPTWLAGIVILSEKSRDSAALFGLGVGLGLLSLSLLARAFLKRLRAKADPT